MCGKIDQMIYSSNFKDAFNSLTEVLDYIDSQLDCKQIGIVDKWLIDHIDTIYNLIWSKNYY
jgi:hypothetical protein